MIPRSLFKDGTIPLFYLIIDNGLIRGLLTLLESGN